MVEMVSTRDLMEWQRVAGRAIFIPLSLRRVGPLRHRHIVPPTRPIVRDGELWFYYSGMRRRFQPDKHRPLVDGRRRYVSVPDNGAILLAKLRLDGFVSMDAGHQEGTLLTVRLHLEGKRMFVNADASGGQIRAEILGPDRHLLVGQERTHPGRSSEGGTEVEGDSRLGRTGREAGPDSLPPEPGQSLRILDGIG